MMAIASVQESVSLGAALWHPDPGISVLICWPDPAFERGDTYNFLYRKSVHSNPKTI
jgi:hypothetical protein